jgi:iron complex transport system substrate-binding protein
VILTQEQCEVCAVTPRDLEGALSDWLDAPPRVLSLAPTTLADVLRDVERVARCLDVEPRGGELVDRLVDRITAIGERSGGSERPRVACLEWTDPLMGAGHWVPELVSLAGGRPVLASHGGDSAWTNLEALAEADPDVIVVMPCGLDLARTRRETEALAAHPDFAALRAWREGRVAVTDGHQFFNRPGPRLVDSLEILAEILRPATFDFGHRGQDWQPL